MREVDKPGPAVPRRGKFWLLVLVSTAALAALLFLVIGNGQSRDLIRIDFGETMEAAPEQRTLGGPVGGEPNDDLLTVAIAGVLSPSATLEHYQELLNYMGQVLGKQTSMLLKPTYAEVNDLVRGQRVDLASVCSLAYVEGNREFGMELLAAPRVNGETVYYSYLIVPSRSSTTELEELRGASFAFTDPMSNSGHLAPTHQLHLIGESPASFFGRHIYTYSHDNSIRAVAGGLTDGAAVDSLVYDQMREDYPDISTNTRVIAQWGPFGMPPLVVHPSMAYDSKVELRDFFLGLHEAAAGRGILKDLDVERFVTVADNSYDSIREMVDEVGW